MADRWKEIERLFQAALELEPEKRCAFLEEQSPDPTVRQEVEELLSHQRQGDRLFQSATWGDCPRLEPGTRLGPYEIAGLIGSGGMGAVYEGTDTRLGRTIAVKVSARRFSGRFEREARAIAALNHPNVCTLFDVGPNFLVMEFVRGETLAVRIAHGLFPATEVAKRGAEICHAVAAAHALGIVHRDLKPGNIMLTKEGVKVLDFGLAKLAADNASSLQSAGDGAIVGTRAYMAPEQVAGLKCDSRSDIYSIGLILCEMLTGKRALGNSGETTDPQETALRRVIRRCLASDPEERWQSAKDLATNLEWAGLGLTPPAMFYRRPWFIAILAAAILGAVVAWYSLRPEMRPLEAHFVLSPPDGTRIALRMPTKALISVSPDGENLVLVAQDEEGSRALYLRPLKSDAYQKLEQTDGASLAFWSPDSRWIGFFADGHIKKIPVAGGAVQTITDVRQGDGEGAAWSPNGTIVFAPPRVRPAAMPDGALYSVPSSGGTATPATALDATKGEVSHSWPQFLPGGRRFLYLARTKNSANSEIHVQEVGSRERIASFPSMTQVVFAKVPKGDSYLLFPRDRALFARAWSPKTLQFSGEPVAIASEVRYNTMYGTSGYSVSDNGILVYRAGVISAGLSPIRQLVWYSRSGERLGTVGEQGYFTNIALSPDETKVAIDRLTSPGDPNHWDLWVLELANGARAFSRLTHDASYFGPVWAPDSSRIAAIATSGRGSELVGVSLASAKPLILLSKPIPRSLWNWSPDGGKLFIGSDGSAAQEIDVETGSAHRLLEDEVVPRNLNVSPDRRWIAWQADDSGRTEIYLAEYPSLKQKRQISGEGGSQPLWRKDSRELYFLAANTKMMAVEIRPGPAIVSEPKVLFPAPTDGNPAAHQYAVTGNGSKFLFMESVRGGVETGNEQFHVKMNWFAELSVQKSVIRGSAPNQ